MDELQLIAAYREGKPVYEVVPAKALADGSFEILSCPGFAPGFARGDVVRKNPGEPLGYSIEKRGGYVCVQTFFKSYSQADHSTIVRMVQQAGGIVEGGMDNEAGRLLIFAFHISIGFERIGKTMSEIAEKTTMVKWFYGNVYDAKDGKTPLNWWIKPG